MYCTLEYKVVKNTLYKSKVLCICAPVYINIYLEGVKSVIKQQAIVERLPDGKK